MSKNIIGSIFFLTFSSFYFVNVFNIKKLPGSDFDVMTASTFPFYIAVAGIVLSSIMLILSLVNRNNKDESVISLSYIKSLDLKTTLYFVVAMLFYGFTIRSLGFIVSTMLFLAIGFLLLKERNFKRIFLVSVGVSVGFYLILNNLLGVYIDPGFMFDFMKGEG